MGSYQIDGLVQDCCNSIMLLTHWTLGDFYDILDE